MPAIALVDVSRTYRNGDLQVPVLRSVSLQIERGEFVAIMGPSGSGKSTLLNIIGCLDRFDSGEYRLGERSVPARAGADGAVMIDRDMAAIRRHAIGFVFQTYNLIPRMSALRNVELPMIYQGLGRLERRQRATTLLTRMGLAERLQHRPAQLSGGQQQRVAIARALANRPSVLIADEPTGSLDSATGSDIIAAFESLHREGMTIVMVTHERDVAAHADRVIELVDGHVIA